MLLFFPRFRGQRLLVRLFFLRGLFSQRNRLLRRASPPRNSQLFDFQHII